MNQYDPFGYINSLVNAQQLNQAMQQYPIHQAPRGVPIPISNPATSQDYQPEPDKALLLLED